MGDDRASPRWRSFAARTGVRPGDDAARVKVDTGEVGVRSGRHEAAIVADALLDRRAFAPLYRRYAPEVYRFCLRRLRTREAAEDATSLVFERVLNALPGFRGDAFAPWLFAIAHNTCVSLGRRQGAQVLPEAFDPPDPGPGPETLVIAEDDARTLWSLLDRLPDDQRHVIELRLSGLRGTEIAAALGRTPGAVRMLQFRAMGRLRQGFAELDGWIDGAGGRDGREDDHDATR